MRSITSFVTVHGYWMLALGCLAEGEIVLVLAGYAAQRGLLRLPWVIVIAACMGFAADNALFAVGRRYGRAWLARFPSLSAKAARVSSWLAGGRQWVVLWLRFAYGLRIVGPLLVGTSSLPATRFAVLDAVGAASWAVLFTLLGWGLGGAAAALIGDVERVERWLIPSLLGVGLVVWLLRSWFGHRRR